MGLDSDEAQKLTETDRLQTGSLRSPLSEAPLNVEQKFESGSAKGSDASSREKIPI